MEALGLVLTLPWSFLVRLSKSEESKSFRLSIAGRRASTRSEDRFGQAAVDSAAPLDRDQLSARCLCWLPIGALTCGALRQFHFRDPRVCPRRSCSPFL